MNTRIKVFLFFILMGCEGSEGHIAYYTFNTSKFEVEQALLKLEGKDSIDILMQPIDLEKSLFFEKLYITSNKQPKEDFLASFTGDSSEWLHSNTCRLSLDAIYNDGWKFRQSLTNAEEKQIQKSFEKYILDKTSLHYNKAY